MIRLVVLALAFIASQWTMDFDVDDSDLASVGVNPYFSLEPGYALNLSAGAQELTITVLNETRKFGNVETRIVEERETKAGKPVEVSRNFYAISKRTNAVFYFGEDVDTYRDGKVSGHEDAWLSGMNGARFGLMM